MRTRLCRHQVNEDLPLVDFRLFQLMTAFVAANLSQFLRLTLRYQAKKSFRQRIAARYIPGFVHGTIML